MHSGISTKQSMKGSNTMADQKRPSKITKAFEKTALQIKNDILDDLLQVYSWRSKTDLPIAKVMFYKVINKNLKEIFSTVQVSYQTTQFTISDLAQISIENTLYLLQQSTIGFQKLYQVFGSFLISNKMIIINKNNKCKVWINQNLSVNQPIAVQMFKNQPQKVFIQQILAIFQKKCKKSGVSNQFIGQVMNSKTFQQILTCVNSFATFKKIIIPTSLKIQQARDRYMPSKSPIKNSSQLNSNTSNSFIQNKDKSIPKFLNKSNIKTTQSSTISSRINQNLREKSKSIGKCVTPSKYVQQNKSQIFLKGHFQPKQLKRSIQNQEKSDKQSNDYSFQQKKIPIQEDAKNKNKNDNKKQLGSSTNSFSHDEIQQIFEGKGRKKNKQISKSQLKTSFSLNQNQHQSTSLFKLAKKTSLFDQERNMLQSIVHGQDEYKNPSHSTFELTKLGKLGRHIGQSRMPQDF